MPPTTCLLQLHQAPTQSADFPSLQHLIPKTSPSTQPPINPFPASTMTTNETSCVVCGSTAHSRGTCRYKSHVKLFSTEGNRGVWSIGSNLVVKERSGHIPSYEAPTLRFLESNTTIPVAKVI
ncbi:hypothetical protein ACHAPT_009294 [Fusarium lateritium]